MPEHWFAGLAGLAGLAASCAALGSAADRLPQTLAALAAGKIHPVHVRIIEDETSILPPQDAAAADEKLAGAARSKTFSQLRYAAHLLVLKLDPDAARRPLRPGPHHPLAPRRTHVPL